jgi:2',3'-cyclic-nucleotide 2'-phosphodiesterase (5'-nucleotidase family)
LSKGIKAKYNLHFNTAGGPKVMDILVRGQPVDLEKVYNVATTSFYFYECGDGVTAFHGKPVIWEPTDSLCSEVMIQYLKTLDSISGIPPKRLLHI